jgi:hypothetical protein
MYLNKLSKIVAAILLVASVVVAGLYALNWVAVQYSLSGVCGNSVQAEAPSPNSKLRAIVFERDCGATTGVSHQISILRAGRVLPNEAGNIFRAEMYYGYAPDNPDRSNAKIEVRWVGNDELVITTHNRRAKIFHVAQEFQGIRIRHEVTPGAASNNAMQPTANSVAFMRETRR